MPENGDRALLHALPLPLAQAWRRALYAEAPLEVHDRALLTLEATVKYLASIAAAAWVARGAEGLEPRKACEALVRPSLGQWAAILRTCGGALGEDDAARRWLDGILRRPVSIAVEGLKGPTVEHILETAPSYRNALVHGTGLQPESAAERAPQLADLAREVLHALVPEGAPALTSVAGARSVRLMGVGVGLEASPPAGRTGTVTIRFESEIIVLSPLWIFDPAEDDVLVLNKGAGLRKVEYLSYGTSHGGTGLVIKRGATAERAARFLEAATGKEKLDAEDVAALIEEAEVRTLRSRATEQHIGPFRIVRQAAKGGQGILYEAIQEDPPRRVALKVLPLQSAVEESARRRFREEGEALARVEHPGVVPVYATGEHDGVPWIAMKFVEGKTLAEVLAGLQGHAGAVTLLDWNRAASSGTDRPESEAKKPHAERVAEIARDAARALQACHENGVVHRDVKPSNMMLDEEGRVLLTDFGLARTMQARTRTVTRRFVGTLQYAAPEALLPAGKKAPDARVDVYGLGATLYEALALRRPFQEYEADEGALLHAVQSKDPPTLRKIAPWVPKDLCTIVMKALEKDRDRRYATARELADDLQRYLAEEPILAKPAGPVTRSRKWARRNPGRAVMIAAAGVIVLASAGLLLGQKIARDRAVALNIVQARRELQAGNYGEALKAVARALDRDCTSGTATRLEAEIREAERNAASEAKRDRDLNAAARARAEAEQKNREYEQGKKALAPVRQEARQLYLECIEGYAPTAKRAKLNQLENEVQRKEERLAELLAESREAIERAFRQESPYHEGRPGPETRDALADFRMGRFREELAAGNLEGARRLAKAVRGYDEAGRHAKELLDRGTLTVNVDPEEAEAFLFRYESYETVRRDPPVVPRLVPVPTTGVGRVRKGPWLDNVDFFPGDLCLKVTEVEKGSIAAKAGLVPGDLVIRLNGQPCGDGVFMVCVDADSPLAKAGLKPISRIVSINGEVVEGVWDWWKAKAPEDGTERIRFAGASQAVACHRKAFPCAEDVDLVPARVPAAMRLLCVHAGRAVKLEVPKYTPSGLNVEVTAYPLILSPENRIDPDQVHEIDPGSYLLFVKREGYEDQRYPVLVPWQESAAVEVKLLAARSTPRGFVYVPPGPFLSGGDPDAFQAGPRRKRACKGFFIGRKEVTYREWFKFVNDPGSLSAIATARKAGKMIYLPRAPSDPMGYSKPSKDGQYDLDQPKTTPVLGISFNDIRAYLAWRNQRAEERHEPWRYELPDEWEWEKAARGADGRFFPWGNRFDPSLTVGLYRKKVRIHSVPGGFEPRDESPYGVLDMAGSRYEWCGNEFEPGAISRPLRGGAWPNVSVRSFRSAQRIGSDSLERPRSPGGFRVVARPRP